MRKLFLKCFLFVCVFFFASSSFSQVITENLDNIPRNRLVTDAELLSLADSSIPAINNGLIEERLKSLSKYFLNRKNINYFFDIYNFHAQLDEFEKIYPARLKSVRKKADEYEMTYGTDLIWKIPGHDKVGREHTPNTIRFISRFPRAFENALSAAFFNEEKYSKVLIEQLKDFINDYEHGQTETGENDVFERYYAGHRTRNVLFAYFALLAADKITVEENIFMLKVFLLHGARLIDDCKKFSWGNHQLHGLAGLYEMSIMFPEFRVMKLWNELALNTIMQHIDKEIKEDGFQFERASHYFKLDIMNYFRIYKISILNGKELPTMFNERFKKMFDAVVNLALPTKALPVLQDAQAFYNSQKDSLENNDAAELADPNEALFLSIGAAVFNNPVYKYFGSKNIYPELFWFLSKEEIDNYHKLRAQKPDIGSTALEDSKYFVMRTGWTNDDLYMIVDGGLAQYKPDHTHGGVLGVMAYGFGDELLPTYRVRYSDPQYKYLKNSLVKNVALANRYLQGQNWIDNNARTGFGIWEFLPNPTVNKWMSGNNYDYFNASHNGFDKFGINYERSIFFVKPHFWIFVDKFISDKINSYQQIWQGDYSPLDNINGVVKHNGNSNLFVIQSDEADMDIQPYSKYGVNSLMFEKKGAINYSFNSIVYPTLKNDDEIPAIKTFEKKNYKLITAGKGKLKSSIYFKKETEINLAEIKTDAEFVCLTYSADILNTVLLYNGSKLIIDELHLNTPAPATIELYKINGKWNFIMHNGDKEKINLIYNDVEK